MNPRELLQLKALIVATSAYYGTEISDEVLALFVEDLADLPFDRVAQAIKEVRRDPKTTRFPLPAVIRARIEVAPTDDDQVQDAVSRLVEAVSRFGWNNPEQAKAHVGELAWAIVKREGGWQSVCEYLNSENLGTARAQWRQLGLSLSRSSRAGTLSSAPALPKPEGSQELGSLDFKRLLPRPEESA